VERWYGGVLWWSTKEVKSEDKFFQLLEKCPIAILRFGQHGCIVSELRPGMARGQRKSEIDILGAKGEERAA
jgi:hypothetical protein